MKYELDTQPTCFNEEWPGQLKIFSWMEYVTAVPQVMSVITTWKEGRIPNACLQAWSIYTGDNGGFHVIFSIMNHYHTTANILRTKEFIVNFPTIDISPQCYKTVTNNAKETDEITTAGLTIEKAKIVDAPRIKECFLHLECKYEWHRPLHEGSLLSLFSGKVVHVGIDKMFAQIGTKKRYGANGFTIYLSPSKDIETGQQESLWVGKAEPIQARS